MKYLVILFLLFEASNAIDLSILQSALKDLNVQEYKQKNISNPKINKYHKSTGHNYDDNIPWCSSFLNYHVKKVGYQGTNSAAAGSWRKWGVKSKRPLVGAIAVMPRYEKGKRVGNHVGIIKEIHGDSIVLLGGNQGKEGFGKVSTQTYKLKMFDSFRIPPSLIPTLDGKTKYAQKSEKKKKKEYKTDGVYYEYEEIKNSMGDVS